MNNDYLCPDDSVLNGVAEAKPSKINILQELQHTKYIMPVETLSEPVCPNPECKYYLMTEGKAIIKRGKYKTGHQRYYCKHCGKFFMDTKGTSVYRKHLSADEIRLIYRLFLEKNGIRSIERITGHHRDTVSHLINGTVKNPKTEEYLVKQIGLTPSECEKLWLLLEKKRESSRKSP